MIFSLQKYLDEADFDKVMSGESWEVSPDYETVLSGAK